MYARPVEEVHVEWGKPGRLTCSNIGVRVRPLWTSIKPEPKSETDHQKGHYTKQRWNSTYSYSPQLQPHTISIWSAFVAESTITMPTRKKFSPFATQIWWIFVVNKNAKMPIRRRRQYPVLSVLRDKQYAVIWTLNHGNIRFFARIYFLNNKINFKNYGFLLHKCIKGQLIIDVVSTIMTLVQLFFEYSRLYLFWYDFWKSLY